MAAAVVVAVVAAVVAAAAVVETFAVPFCFSSCFVSVTAVYSFHSSLSNNRTECILEPPSKDKDRNKNSRTKCILVLSSKDKYHNAKKDLIQLNTLIFEGTNKQL